MAYLLLNYSLLVDMPAPDASDRPTPESGDALAIGLEKNGQLFLIAVYGDITGMNDEVGALLDSITLGEDTGTGEATTTEETAAADEPADSGGETTAAVPTVS